MVFVCVSWGGTCRSIDFIRKYNDNSIAVCPRMLSTYVFVFRLRLTSEVFTGSIHHNHRRETTTIPTTVIDMPPTEMLTRLIDSIPGGVGKGGEARGGADGGERCRGR